jgi:hypothetical protein
MKLIEAKLDHLYGYPVYLRGERIGDLEVRRYGWGADKGQPSQTWEFRSHGHPVGLTIERTVIRGWWRYKKDLLAAMEQAANNPTT